MINSNRLKKRVDALEAGTGPKVIVIETWADLMRCTFEDNTTVLVSDKIAALIEEVRNERETP